MIKLTRRIICSELQSYGWLSVDGQCFLDFVIMFEELYYKAAMCKGSRILLHSSEAAGI
jgi:hypothetical protein